MKLYMKQKAFSWGEKYLIKDSNGYDKYIALGEIYPVFSKIYLYDMEETELAYINQRLIPIVQSHNVAIFDDINFRISQRFNFSKQIYYIPELDWVIKGDFLSHEYKIYDSDKDPVMTMTKECISWGDSYLIDIYEDMNELRCLCVVIAIDSNAKETGRMVYA